MPVGLYLSWGDVEHVLLAVLACLDVSELVVDLFVRESDHTCKMKNSDVSSLDIQRHHIGSWEQILPVMRAWWMSPRSLHPVELAGDAHI
jgi:hypothetical protein